MTSAMSKSKITWTEDWGGWDELDGKRLVNRDRLSVTWPDGTTEEVDVKIVDSHVVPSRVDDAITYSRAYAIRDYHGVVVLVPIAGLEAARR